MKAIQPFAEIMDVDIGVNVLKKIELVGRTCYKSTENIKDGSAEKFVANLISRGHEAMLEHGSFCFMIPYGEWRGLQIMIQNFETHNGFKCFLRFTNEGRCLVSGNIRAWRDFLTVCLEQTDYLPYYFHKFLESHPILFPEFQKDIKYCGRDHVRMIPMGRDDLIGETELLTHGDVTVRFVLDRGISHELVRHRPASFAQESTRYCNYGKDKFGGEITFIIPEFFQYDSLQWHMWNNAMKTAEDTYLNMMDIGVTPEQARTVLPNSVKTEVIMTANCAEWRHFFELRACNSTGKAHPQMLEVTRPLLDDFKKTINFIFDDLIYEKKGVCV